MSDSSAAGTHGVRVTLAYDGTRFHGYQRQAQQRTVQGVLEAAIEAVTGRSSPARAAGRTDAGVHALAQVVAFDTDKWLEPRRWVLALNAHLPDDVAVQDAETCAPGYNPRFDAVDKTYRYLFDLGPVRHPLLRDRVWHLGSQVERSFADPTRLKGSTVTLDRQAMTVAAQRLVGTHDFRAFRSADDDRDNTTRTLHRVDLINDYTADPRLMALEVTGTAFMKNMVRIIAGTLLDVGRRRITIQDVDTLLSASGIRHAGGPTAPACGLTLVHVSLGRIREPASR